VARVATVADLPATATQGDMYIVNETGDAWIWSAAAAAFENAGPLVGPTGPQGIQGIQGIQGGQGPAGPIVVSADANNKAILGTDGFIYVPAVSTNTKLFTRSQWTRTLTANLNINDNQVLNLFNGTSALRETDKVAAGTDAYDAYVIASNKITIPWAGVVLHHLIRVNLTFVVGGSETLTLSLRRATDNSVIGAPVILQRLNDAANNQVIFSTYTSSAADPFVTGGFYIQVANDSNTNVALANGTQIGVYINTTYASPRVLT
jgi:hypothetical protein